MPLKNPEKDMSCIDFLDVTFDIEKISSQTWFIKNAITDKPVNWIVKDRKGNSKQTDKLRKIFKLYEIKNVVEVLKFLNQHQELIDVILWANPEIRKYFPVEKLRLTLYVDPESPDWEYLILAICANTDNVDETLNKLDNFNENWWNNASRGVAVNLSIDVEFE